MVYLHLYHGRPDPTLQMEDWGHDGPCFEAEMIICDYLPTNNGIKLIYQNNLEGWISWVGDVMYYDGKFYGCWSIKSDPGGNEISRFRPELAEVPAILTRR